MKFIQPFWDNSSCFVCDWNWITSPNLMFNRHATIWPWRDVKIYWFLSTQMPNRRNADYAYGKGGLQKFVFEMKYYLICKNKAKTKGIQKRWDLIKFRIEICSYTCKAKLTKTFTTLSDWKINCPLKPKSGRTDGGQVVILRHQAIKYNQLQMINLFANHRICSWSVTNLAHPLRWIISGPFY